VYHCHKYQTVPYCYDFFCYFLFVICICCELVIVNYCDLHIAVIIKVLK